MRLSPPTDKQALVLQHTQHPVRIHVWSGSVRSGKTINSLLAWALFVTTAPPGELLMAGRTFATLKRNVLAPLAEMFGDDNIHIGKGPNSVSTVFGRQVHLVGSDDSGAETRIRGFTLAGSYVDELSIIGGPGGEVWWNQLLLRHSVPGAKIFATTNPDHPNHWLLKKFLSKDSVTIKGTEPITVIKTDRANPIDLYHYHFTLEDNPALTEKYIATSKAAYEGVFYQRFILGEWVAAEGAVFPTFTPAPKPPTTAIQDVTELMLGIDVGTTNPTHSVLVGVLNGTLFVLGEHRNTDASKTFGTQVDDILNWLDSIGVRDRVNVVVDPSARAFRNEWKLRAGVWTWSADNSVMLGISDLGTLFKNNLLHVSPQSAPVLVGELQGYRWDSKASVKGEDRPVKQDDHGVDALRYATQALKKTWKPWLEDSYSPAPPEPFTPAWLQNSR